MNPDKPYQKNRLIVEFGILIQPYSELAQSQSVPEVGEYRIAFAKVYSGDSLFRARVNDFATFNDVRFATEQNDISHVQERFSIKYRNLDEIINQKSINELHKMFIQDFENMKSEFIEKVDRIPIDWQPKIFQANTPFTTYLCMLDCIANVRQHLHYFDRYLNLDFFSLYLRNLDRSTSIRLVTTKGHNRRDGFGVDKINRVSDLCCQEFNDYKLIQLDRTDFHDRNLRVDEQVFILGPGTTKAGTVPTNFGPADSSPQAIKILDDLIAKGEVIHES